MFAVSRFTGLLFYVGTAQKNTVLQYYM